ncbi:tryptophan synthase beta chain 2-like [Vulpes lagopus]|uniref:tryptophan synthase beta chain 2-like n=1 Tax=Vulpes lagopus TaxID=494514 RepID=UPI001BC9AB4F|nr:tryptophan synthase beta chain 2-like [Vulpes lagopus]
MPNKPLPPLNPQTHQPMNADDLSHVFNKECSKQELDTEHAWIDIPEDVLEKYTFYRSTPLVRAYALEEALGTPAHIYFKNESINPLGSHKINSAIPQCYYCKQEGDTNVTTETGAGQWGAALSYAAKLYGLEAAVYQTIIGLEAEKQMAMAGEYPDQVIACFGGGSNFGGIAFPFLRHNFTGERHTEFIAAEPESCPKLTRGGLRYHGAGMIISQLLKDGYLHGVDIPQLESFKSGMLFAQTEGIIPAPESCHAIAATIREALKAKEEGKEKVILFCLSGHGLIDMPSYDSFINGDLHDYSVSDEEIQQFLKDVPKVD